MGGRRDHTGSPYDLIAIDEVGYVPRRAEREAVVLATNLLFSEWTQVISNARRWKALLDRITDRARILETGTESYRFRRLRRSRRKKPNRTDRKAVEMTVRGKPGKANPGYSTLFTALGNRCAIPPFPPLRRLDLYEGEGRKEIELSVRTGDSGAPYLRRQ